MANENGGGARKSRIDTATDEIFGQIENELANIKGDTARAATADARGYTMRLSERLSDVRGFVKNAVRKADRDATDMALGDIVAAEKLDRAAKREGKPSFFAACLRFERAGQPLPYELAEWKRGIDQLAS